MNTDSSTHPKRRRVPALAPQERRAALIAVTIPLLREHGLLVSTGQIADAAGVAEGTIFGVFPDKATLIRAAVVAAMDPTSTVAALRGLDTTQGLRERLEATADLLVRRMADGVLLISAIRSGVFNVDGAEAPAELLSGRQAVLAAVADVIEPDRDLLRWTPAATARLLVSMAFAAGNGGFGITEPLAGHEIVSLLLDGLLVREPSDIHPSKFLEEGNSQC